ncbi:MAG TPA: aldo/keto reductase [Caulobacteraceae bacterium]|jgi:aryl-alcohol dehydrogenase-like predicted oxidoreductase
MRYRPFGHTGIAVSALSLSLDGDGDRRKPEEWRAFVHAAFEEGINSFEFVKPSQAMLEGFAEGASVVKRSLLFLTLRADPALEGRRLEGWVADVIGRAGIGELNLLTIEATAPEFDGSLVAGLRLKDINLVRRLSVAGYGDQVTDHLEDPLFDAVIMPFGILSGWRDRNLTRVALERQMGVIASDPCPEGLLGLAEQAVQEAKPGWFKRPEPLKGAGTYAFLQHTRGWTPEQICVAYALTEPAVATALMAVDDVKHMALLAQATDRDLPSSVTAQIEMARFSNEREAGTERRAKRRA